MTRNKERWALVFFFLFSVFLIIGGANGIREMIEYYDHYVPLWDESPAWPTTSGTITTSRVDEHHRYEEATRYRLDVTYEYSVDGQQYVSDNFDFWASQFTRRSQAQDMVEKYLSGTSVIVHYDPDNPENAVLIPGCSGCRRSPFMGWEYGAIVSGSLILLGYLVYIIWWLRRRLQSAKRS
jgi:hypothetical protein